MPHRGEHDAHAVILHITLDLGIQPAYLPRVENFLQSLSMCAQALCQGDVGS